VCQRRRRHQQWMQAMPPMSAVAAAGVAVTCSGGGVRAGGVLCGGTGSTRWRDTGVGDDGHAVNDGGVWARPMRRVEVARRRVQFVFFVIPMRGVADAGMAAGR
jgi:hypothetical protein